MKQVVHFGWNKEWFPFDTLRHIYTSNIITKSYLEFKPSAIRYNLTAGKGLGWYLPLNDCIFLPYGNSSFIPVYKYKAYI